MKFIQSDDIDIEKREVIENDYGCYVMSVRTLAWEYFAAFISHSSN